MYKSSIFVVGESSLILNFSVAGDPGVDTTPGEDTTPGGCIDKESKPYCAVVEKFGCDTKRVTDQGLMGT